MNNHRVWTPIKLKGVPSRANILTSIWAMNKKSSVVHRVSLNALGYEKLDGFRYDSSNIASSVTNYMSIKIVLVLEIFSSWTTKTLNFKVSILNGEFTDNEEIFYMEIKPVF